MKRTIIGWLSAGVVLTLLLVGCDNDQHATGLDLLPEYLRGEPISKDFALSLHTVPAGTEAGHNDIYVGSALGYLGRMSSEEFGGIETAYLTQFRVPSGFRFKDESVITGIDSVRLYLYYDGFAGDTISSMTVSVNRVKKPLKHNKYSITEVAEYVGEEELGSLSYWAGRGSQKIPNNSGKGNYMLSIPLPQELGQEFLKLSKAGDPVFANQAAFDEWFSGLYLHTIAGQGSVIRVTSTELAFWYTKEVEVEDPKTKEKKKEPKPFAQRLIHTSEVPQLSRFANFRIDKLLQNQEFATIKAPAGLWIRATLPTSAIAKELKEAPAGYSRTLNAVTYTLQGSTATATTATKYGIPETLLMLPVDSTKMFFEKELTENSVGAAYTSFIGEMVVRGSSTYHFGNIGSAILKHIQKEPNKDLEVFIIPVELMKASQEMGGGTISLTHLVPPSAVKFAINPQNTKLQATIIQRREGQPF